MAKKQPNQLNEYSAHFNRVDRYIALMDNLYSVATNEIANVISTASFDANDPATLLNNPQVKKAFNEAINTLSNGIGSLIVNGVTAEWNGSNVITDELVRSALGMYGVVLEKDSKDNWIIPEKYKKYFNNNADALKSFITRKDKGLNLSKKVWKYVGHYREELELCLEAGITDGKSADQLARDIRKHLEEPDRLFRRVRNDKGDLNPSKAARICTPEPGAYLSSVRNSQRVARTEINMAYRAAEQARWNQLDFVVGYEIKRSHRITDCSVCQALIGKYPKDYVFAGFHPHCRCYVIPILMTDDEFWNSDNDDSKNKVTDVSDGYKAWIKDNAERIKEATENGTLPYFIKDNAKYCNY